jgi:hypothetical protein
VSETEALFGVLRQSADAGCAAPIEDAVANAPDHELCRLNPLGFATKNKLDEERTIAAFLHATRLGLFELSSNVLCPDCGGVLDAGTTLVPSGARTLLNTIDSACRAWVRPGQR